VKLENVSKFKYLGTPTHGNEVHFETRMMMMIMIIKFKMSSPRTKVLKAG
jgi:hypothetical protein